MLEFNPLEWNALINRVRATLQAQYLCHGGEGSRQQACLDCPLGGPLEEAAATLGQEPPCRQRFRETEQHLRQLAGNARSGEFLQLRRTIDSLNLAYRAIWEGDHECACGSVCGLGGSGATSGGS